MWKYTFKIIKRHVWTLTTIRSQDRNTENKANKKRKDKRQKFKKMEIDYKMQKQSCNQEKKIEICPQNRQQSYGCKM